MDSIQYFKQNDQVLWRCLFIWACEGLSTPKALHIDVWEMAGVTAMAVGGEQTQSAHACDVSLEARIPLIRVHVSTLTCRQCLTTRADNNTVNRRTGQVGDYRVFVVLNIRMSILFEFNSWILYWKEHKYLEHCSLKQNTDTYLTCNQYFWNHVASKRKNDELIFFLCAARRACRVSLSFTV